MSSAAAAAARASQRLVVAAAKNGRAIACDVDATKFILAYPRGAYTAARTVGQTKIFDYEAHVQRLVDSTLAMHADADQTLVPTAVADALRPRTEATLRAAMSEFKQQFGAQPHEEYKITVLVCDREASQDDSSDDAAQPTPLARTDIYCHIGLLPPLRSGLVKLLVAGLPRQNAAAKDSGWVRERKAIYDAMPADVEEIILMDPATHALLEGSQTNFYAVRDGVIYTAHDGILKGTVRALVLDVCAELAIPVVLEPPSLDDVADWDGCFISSTSRLVLGARELAFTHPVTQQPTTRTFAPSPVIEAIINAVRASVERKSTQVL